MSSVGPEVTDRQRVFADNVRRRRNELGLTQADLAFKAGIDRTYIASLETGRRNVSLDLIGELANALDCDAADLVVGIQNAIGRERKRRSR